MARQAAYYAKAMQAAVGAAPSGAWNRPAMTGSQDEPGDSISGCAAAGPLREPPTGDSKDEMACLLFVLSSFHLSMFLTRRDCEPLEGTFNLNEGQLGQVRDREVTRIDLMTLKVLQDLRWMNIQIWILTMIVGVAAVAML